MMRSLFMVRENVTVDPRVELLKQLADPVRLRVVDRLGHGGPATLSRLGAELDVPLPLLSNHLRRLPAELAAPLPRPSTPPRRLRPAGLVSVERQGRHAIYSLGDPGLQALMPLLDRLTGRALERAGRAPEAASVPSRTCYDHLG